MSGIKVFSGPDYSYCRAAKKLLERHGLNYREHDVSDGAVLAAFRERLPRVRAIPQIFVDGDHVGGLEDLQLWLERTGKKSR